VLRPPGGVGSMRWWWEADGFSGKTDAMILPLTMTDILEEQLARKLA